MKAKFVIASALILFGCSHQAPHDSLAAKPEPSPTPPLILTTSDVRLPCEMRKGVCFVQPPINGLASEKLAIDTASPASAKILKNFIVKIETKHKRVTFYSADAWKDDGSYRSLDMDFAGDVPVMKATLAGKARNGLPQKGLEGRFMIDTARTSAGLFLAPKFQADHAEFFEHVKKSKQTSSGEAQFSEGTITSVKLAVDVIPQVKAAFLTNAPSPYANGDIDGGIGPELLRYFEFVLDYPHKVIYFRRVN